METAYRLYKHAWIGTSADGEHKLSQQECRKLLRGGGFLVRNVYDFDCSKQTFFWYVIKDSFGGLEELSTGARRDVRRSLRIYDIERISIDVLKEEGYTIYATAQATYRVHCDVFTREEFDKLIAGYRTATGKEFWGVRNKETKELVAIAINTICANSCEYNILKCKPEALRDGSQPYYGLIYEMNKYYLEKLHLKYVNDGARTITNHSNIQSFLIQKFKFRKAYCRLSITYCWWLAPIIKIVYPFRRFIHKPQVVALMNMEAMARGEI